MDEVDEAAQVLRIGLGQDAVAEVEDVAGSCRCLGEDRPCTGLRRFPPSQQPRRVEVALDTSIRPESPPRLGQRLPVVDADTRVPVSAARVMLLDSDSSIVVETIAAGTPVISSSRAMYARASRGRSSNRRMPFVGADHPGSCS